MGYKHYLICVVQLVSVRRNLVPASKKTCPVDWQSIACFRENDLEIVVPNEDSEDELSLDENEEADDKVGKCASHLFKLLIF